MAQGPIASMLMRKNGYLLGFISCFSIVGLALWIQTQNHLEPCPLCITQRICFMALGLAFLLGAFAKPKTWFRAVTTFLQLVAALVGAGWATRHWYIQANKESMITDCGVGFDYMFQNFPLEKALTLVFQGTGDCAEIDWTFLGLTLPQLALICFIAYGIYAVWLYMINHRSDDLFSKI